MRRSVIALMSVIVIALAAALWTIGGPSQARAERRDMTRWQDLQLLAWHIDCLLLDSRPMTGESDVCPNPPRWTDPFLDEPYVVDQVTEHHITLCAAFETNLSQIIFDSVAQRHDPQRGCVVIRRQVQARPA